MSRWTIVILLFSCSALVLGYELGSEYRYSYETTVLVDEMCSTSQNASYDVGHRIQTEVDISVVWEDPTNPQRKVIRIQMPNVHLSLSKKSSFVNHPLTSPVAKSSPSYLLLVNGVVEKAWDSQQDHTTVRNMRRGIASLLQFQKQNMQKKETDVSGICEVRYETKGDTIMRKNKSDCRPTRFDDSLSMLTGVRSVDVAVSSISDYDFLGGDTIAKCSTKETVLVSSGTWKRPKLCVHSRSELIFEGVTKSKNLFPNMNLEVLLENIKKSHPGELEENDLEAIIAMPAETSKKPLLESLNKYAESLKSSRLASVKSAAAFYKLLPILRTSSKKDILKVLQTSKLKPIIPQILDLLAASLTDHSVKAAFEHFAKVAEYDERLERFLVSLSVCPRPRLIMMQHLKSFIEKTTRNEKILATLVSTLGALLNNYAQKNPNDPAAEEFRLYLESSLQQCSTDDCILSHLRAVRNAGRPQSAPLLLKYAARGGKVALEALNAINNLQHVNEQTKKDLLRVFLQMGARQDRSTRAIAAQVLLRHDPDEDLVRGVLRSLRDQSDPEFSTHLAAKIRHLARQDEQLRRKVKKILCEKEVSQYYSLAQKGDSAILTKPLMEAEGMNATYSIDLEMLEGGLLKRTAFDVHFQTIGGTDNFLSVGIFAQGLGSIAGGGGGDEWEEEESPAAGMEITLLASQLRPYVFFSSTSELMGHAWSGTASEPTPALQGIYLFSDDERVHILSNGMPVRIQLRGVLSADSSGSIQVSLWNRNSKSLVKNAGALLVRGTVIVDEGGVATTQGTVHFSGQAAIDFKTDTAFASAPFRMCLKMEHPHITVKHEVHRKVSSGNYSLRRSRRRRSEVEGRSFPLHPKNSEMCTLMDS